MRTLILAFWALVISASAAHADPITALIVGVVGSIGSVVSIGTIATSLLTTAIGIPLSFAPEQMRFGK